MSIQESDTGSGGWQIDWQDWPFELSNADPSPALHAPSSHMDIAQSACGQDMQTQFDFIDFNNYNNIGFNPDRPILEDVVNITEPETAPDAVPAGLVEQQQDHVVAEGAVAPKRQRRPRNQGPSAAQWNAKKTMIQDLYMFQDKTLKETMDVMKDTHDFVATPQMFKDKCQEWNFVKNIPRKLAGKLMRIADERKPKGTEFRLGPRKWTTAEIKKKYERGPKSGEPQVLESPELPSNLTYRTPTVSPVVPDALVRQNSVSMPNTSARYFYTGSAMPVRGWTPEAPGPVIAHGRPWTPFNIVSPGAVTSPWVPSPSPRQQNLFQGRMLPPPPLSSATASFPWQNTIHRAVSGRRE